MNHPSLDTRKAEMYLSHWGFWVRNCNRIPIETVTITDSRPPVLELGFEEDLDEIINTLIMPFPRIIRRHYVDEHPGNSHMFFPAHRTIEDKARTESISVATYKNALMIARHLVQNAACTRSWWS